MEKLRHIPDSSSSYLSGSLLVSGRKIQQVTKKIQDEQEEYSFSHPSFASSVRQMQKFGLDPQDIKYVEDRIETLKKELEKSE